MAYLALIFGTICPYNITNSETFLSFRIVISSLLTCCIYMAYIIWNTWSYTLFSRQQEEWKLFQIQRELSFNSAQSAKHCSWGQTVMASVMTMHYAVWISQFWALMSDWRSKAKFGYSDGIVLVRQWVLESAHNLASVRMNDGQSRHCNSWRPIFVNRCNRRRLLPTTWTNCPLC
jgi:hypothetical protein